MPAFRLHVGLTLILVLSTIIILPPASAQTQQQSSSPTASAITRALSWLATNQYPNGSYGSFSEIQAAPAAYALWLSNSSSAKANATFTWLGSEFGDKNSGLWAFPEADISGEILYTLSVSNNLGTLTQDSPGYQLLLGLQQPDGGFKGFYDEKGNQITTSTDTAMALWGLIHAKRIAASNQSAAINFLLSLQNPDGSFNLAPTIASNQYSSLAPEPVSITALATRVLKDASYTGSDPHVLKALNYLSQASAAGNFSGHVYAAALSALAFSSYSITAEASKAVTFMLSNQNPDGGFRDKIRTSEKSNALDTGWVAIALQLVQPQPLPTGLLFGQPPLLLLATIVFAIVVATAVSLYYTRRRSATQTLEGPGP